MRVEEAEVVVPHDPGDPALLVPLADGAVHGLGGVAMGTQWSVRVVLGDPEALRLIEARIIRALDQVVREMSQWEARSEISRFNALAAGEAMTIAPGFAQVLDCALTIAEASGGAFDPTLGGVSEAWGFGVGDAPADAPAPVARDHDWRAIAFDRTARQLRQPGGVTLDLSGIAKGFAVDLVSMRLSEAGVAHHLVEIGGELRASGVKPDGQPWWVEIDNPPGADAVLRRVALTGWSIATSGDWQRRRGAANGGWPHTLSPRAGAPVRDGPRAASVLHRGCMQADALATVMMVLGESEGIAFADRHGVAAHITGADGAAHVSAAWRAML